MPKRKARSPRPKTTSLFRVFPWLEQADPGKPGHPLYLPPVQGAGRIDNPEHYSVLYASDSPVGAIAEAFGNHSVWTEELFVIPAFPQARRSLATYEVEDIGSLDLDDARNLLDRRLRPSDVVTRDRKRTRRWALSIFAEREWDGIRWWSARDPDRGAYGLWNIGLLRVLDVTPLNLDHVAVVEASRSLCRLIDG